MKKFTFLTTLTAVAVASALLLTGCSPQGTKSGSTPKPTSTSTKVVVPKSVEKPTQVDPTNALELKYAKEAFPDVVATKHFTKEQVQLALTSANTYITTSLRTPYFLDGSFAKDGYSPDKLDLYYKDLFSYSAYTQAKDSFAGAGPAAKGDQAQQKLNDALSAFTFNVFLQDGVTVPSECSSNGLCLKSVTPAVTFTKYGESADGRLTVEANATADPLYVIDGKKGYITVSYTYTLNMSVNEFADYSKGRPAIVISGYNNTFKTTNWKEIS